MPSDEILEPPRLSVPGLARPPRVLLAEDDSATRGLLASVLRDEGYDVVEVADGGRFLVGLARTYADGTAYVAYDLVVSDLYMPVCNGLELVEAMRQAGWRTPVILMTAFGDARVRDRAAALGAIVFDKPFELAAMQSTARRLLEEHAARLSAEP